MRKRNFKSQDILCAEAELRDLKVKALVWKRNCETSSRTKFIVWKRNCVTSKSQYFPCAEAERQVAGYSLCGGGIAGLKSQSSCTEAELQVVLN